MSGHNNDTHASSITSSFSLNFSGNLNGKRGAIAEVPQDFSASLCVRINTQNAILTTIITHDKDITVAILIHQIDIMSPTASDDTSMMEQPPTQQRRRRRRTTVEENTHQFDIVSLLFERGMQDLANERLHALLEGGEDDVDEEDTIVEDLMCVEDIQDDDGHTIEAAAADHHINIEPQTSSEHNIQELQTQEEQLQARIQAMEYELSIRRARTDRLRAMINVVQSFHNTASSFSPRHPYHHQKEIRREGGSIPPPPMIPTLELDEPSIILISPCISRSNSVCSSLDGYDDEEEEPSPPCKKQRR